jgi:hypothetical protein
MTSRASILVICLLALAGCVSDGKRSGPGRPPRDALPQRVVPVADGRFTDTDANGYGDTNRVIAYVFTDSRYQIPIAAEGAFSFVLRDLDGGSIREWSFTREEAAARRLTLSVGPGFVFDLSLLAGGGSDHVAATEGELMGAFTPASGEDPIRFRLTAPVVLGRVRPAG